MVSGLDFPIDGPGHKEVDLVPGREAMTADVPRFRTLGVTHATRSGHDDRARCAVMGGETIKSWKLTEDDADVVRLLDLGDRAQGEGAVTVKMED